MGAAASAGGNGEPPVLAVARSLAGEITKDATDGSDFKTEADLRG